ncbi:MAG: bifunctional 2-C-methyl-D-erythritol 4-phosphate cytidylyltransferase/2-C-methyl-D-erythritol 2,4-cyclodiphosphate synthase [Alphaproteobacteria bacterium]|nr:bifunctional 2-C-methyl-D-erythritol 4-phosphate cytidylyltransferase/2-C-methyl-D-erythritol 2,4-cyclodiphosphate synthase [Alphaproteobacteria bacterium]
MTVTAALVVAAGRGRRFGGDVPKQYAMLGGVPVLRRTVQAFLDHPDVDVVRCVIHPDDTDLYADAVRGLDLPPPVHGGAERQDSVRFGLESLAGDGPDKVLIHDAARPFVSEAVITSVIDALDAHPGALPAVAVADTLKRGHGGLAGEAVSRDDLWRAQTPQGFMFAEILSAHRELAGETLTDDTQLFERTGHKVVLTPGDEDNFKITTSEDLMRAERLLAAAHDFRTGTGFDVHAFCAGSGVTLCGVRIPHDHGLEGHSDADAALHALTDAILGAIGAGDIGQHFPPSDSQWKGASSDRFLGHAASLVRKRGGSLVNVDVTIICQAPKIGPHRHAMVEKVAEILDVPADRVSVKATTTEGLGFTGRGEGIAAQASATVRLPA